VTLTGDDLKRVFQAVSSAGSARPPSGLDWAATYAVKATFLQGTQALGHIQMCGSLFLPDGSKPPFRDESGILKSLVDTPASKAFADAERQKLEGR